MWKRKGGKGRATAANPSAVATPRPALSPDDRGELVRQTAYFLSERRGFDPRWDLENWLEAERQVDAGLVGPDSGPKAARPTGAPQ